MMFCFRKSTILFAVAAVLLNYQVLFRCPAPLGSRKSEPESRLKWLKSRTEFVFVNDHNGEEKGVRINLRKKICQQYAVKGSCRRNQNKCKNWHICKSFIEDVDCNDGARK